MCWQMFNNQFWGGGAVWFIAFADFHGVNTPTVFYIKLPT